ncbi:hypothetical protein ACHQM5_012721 [Ranunculus cassubicifolius]
MLLQNLLHKVFCATFYKEILGGSALCKKSHMHVLSSLTKRQTCVLSSWFLVKFIKITRQGVTSNLPFTKSYPLWETLETMEVFKSMQQLPHFRPLAEENEYIREGEAIGYMLSFLAAAEKIRKFKFDESDGTIAETLIALKDFEDLGFDVHIIKDRLEKLLRIKTDFLEYDMERKQIKAEILKEKLEEKRLELSVAEMTEKMREFQEARSNMMKEREIVLMKKQANDSELTALKRSIQETMDEMQQINLQFSSVVAKPW